MPTLQEKIDNLPVEAKQEVTDFINFVTERHKKEEVSSWMALSKKSLDKVWDNPDDDIYNELLKR